MGFQQAERVVASGGDMSAVSNAAVVSCGGDFSTAAAAGGGGTSSAVCGDGMNAGGGGARPRVDPGLPVGAGGGVIFGTGLTTAG